MKNYDNLSKINKNMQKKMVSNYIIFMKMIGIIKEIS